ncbi:MAG: hypothetical protein ACP5VR_09880 [Acidimicrobiales bacterium]
MGMLAVGIAGGVLVAVAIAWRLVVRKRASSALVKALADPQEAARAAAVEVVAAGGISRFARVLWQQAQTETSAVVLERIVEAVVRNQWEPAEDPALVRLRLWAQQRLELGLGQAAHSDPGGDKATGAGEEVGSDKETGGGEEVGAAGRPGSEDPVSYHLARLEALVAEVSEANRSGTWVSRRPKGPGALAGDHGDEASVEGSVHNGETGEPLAKGEEFREESLQPALLAKDEGRVAETGQGVEHSPVAGGRGTTEPEPEAGPEAGIAGALGVPSRSDLVRFLRCYTSTKFEPSKMAPADAPATAREKLAGLVSRAR